MWTASWAPMKMPPVLASEAKGGTPKIVLHRVRHLRRSELEVDLDSQEDGENETLSENPWDSCPW